MISRMASRMASEKRSIFVLSTLAIFFCTVLALAGNGNACTRITLKGEDGTVVTGRTMEWGAFDIEPDSVVIPRGISLTATEMPDGKKGATWKTKYGVVAVTMLHKDAYADALNEKGLSASALYMPGFAKYEDYDPAMADKSIGPLDVVAWITTQFDTIDQVRKAIDAIKVAPTVEQSLGFSPPMHYIVTDSTGASIVIEYLEGALKIYDAPLGVMTNSPSYDWHMTNLRNYMNLRAVGWPEVSNSQIDLTPIGSGSGMLGLPGDFTPPSRFVRAVALSQTARKTTGGFDTVREVFQIMDSFNVPLPLADNEIGKGLSPACCSDTQYTVVADTKNMILYYHTDTARIVRKIDLKQIDFSAGDGKVKKQALRIGEEDAIKDVTPKL